MVQELVSKILRPAFCIMLMIMLHQLLKSIIYEKALKVDIKCNFLPRH